MIDVKELRIGNWVKRVGKVNCTQGERFEQIKSYLDLDTLELPSSFCVGIPLSPDILEKAGFSKIPFQYIDNVKLNYWAKDCVLLFYNETPPENTYLLAYGFTVDGKYYAATTKWIDNLHSLMNAYYSLTQTELNIQL